jgi:hypothetical protein
MVFVYIELQRQSNQVKSLCTQKLSQAKVTAAESRFLRSNLALGIETVVMEMSSNQFY